MTYAEKINCILNEVEKVVVGKRDVIKKVMVVFLAKGHILIEDIPGVGKTTLALAFSKALNLQNKRMQFTPDVLPSDVVGYHILDKEQQMIFREGAIFSNIFLADEINRTSPKTQSALLEVMEEGSVTVDGITRKVPSPFIVIATQNPTGSAGTQLIPESQLDRFMVRLSMGYPDIQSEINILKSKQDMNAMDTVKPILSQNELLEMREECDCVFIQDSVYQYIADLVTKTRNTPELDLGVSPRGTIAIAAMAKAFAFSEGRDFVIPQDVKAIFKDVVCHRFILSTKAKVEHRTADEIAENILKSVQAPKIG